MFRLITQLQLLAAVDTLRGYRDGEEVDEWEANGLIGELDHLLEQGEEIPSSVLPEK